MRLPTTLLALAAIVSAFAGPNDPLPRRAWLGVQLKAEPVEVAGTKGIAVVQPLPGSTAEAAGMRAGDLVLSVDGKAVADVPAIGRAISSVPTGAKVRIEVLRDGKRQVLEAFAKARPADAGPNYDTLYDHAVTKGNRVRMIVTRPKQAGKRPVLFLIQGIGYVSQEQPLTGEGPYSRILKAFSDRGYVTVRVDKPGYGDSEGGPMDQNTFDDEMDAFRQALLKTKTYDFVDPDQVVIFGHSMGGCEGPVLAAEVPVRGIAVYGTVTRSWQEYMVENSRRQAVLAGTSPSEVDNLAKRMFTGLHLLFAEKLTPEEALAKYPQHADAIRTISADGKTLAGIGWKFWPGCFGQNYAAAWERVNAPVLSIWGESEFIASREDHPLIAEIVNAKRPGTAKFVSLPSSDHGFRNVATMKESQATWGQPGKDFNPAIIDVLTKWADEIVAKK
jgi:pimeloyl-ACP methyl ester carboxylesterase